MRLRGNDNHMHVSELQYHNANNHETIPGGLSVVDAIMSVGVCISSEVDEAEG